MADEAIKYFQKAHGLYLKTYADGEHQDIASILLNIGQSNFAKGDAELALSFYRRAYSMFTKFHVFHHPHCHLARRDLIICLEFLQRLPEAIEYQREAVRSAERVADSKSTGLLDERFRLVSLLENASRQEEAKALLQEMLNKAGPSGEREVISRIRTRIDELVNS
jgi:tetratricopeptide (TPR) repeat protein